MFLSRAKLAESKIYNHVSNIKANIKYSLTKTQQIASEEIYKYVINNQSVIVNAVCGAGKTELVYKSIEYFLNNNMIVGFAIPRKDVVIEIYNRLKNDYPSIDIKCVYGGHNIDINGQLIVLTTHQLFRYKKYFDLLILDEADAFPYYDNELLNIFLKDAIKGPIIYLSATIKDAYKKECNNVVYVNRRYHNVDLPVPKFIRYTHFNKEKTLIETIKSLNNKPILIFVPTIAIGKKLSERLNIIFVYSSLLNKQKYIDQFKTNKIKVLITTSILERGITFFDVQVIVYEADHKLFDEATLIQISGRVGRKKMASKGHVYFLASKKSESMKRCILEIMLKNKDIV